MLSGNTPARNKRQVAELAQEDDVVGRLDGTEPVDELVEVESVCRDGRCLGHGKAGQQLGGELQPRRRVGELDERLDVEHRKRQPALPTR